MPLADPGVLPLPIWAGLSRERGHVIQMTHFCLFESRHSINTRSYCAPKCWLRLANFFPGQPCDLGVLLAALCSAINLRASFSSAHAPTLFRSANTIQSDWLISLITYSVIDDSRDGSAVAKPVRCTLPLGNTVRHHTRRLHSGLAKLGVARDLPLDALTFGVEQFAQGFKFGNQVLDFRD